jgi:hypothetical protein
MPHYSSNPPFTINRPERGPRSWRELSSPARQATACLLQRCRAFIAHITRSAWRTL